MRIVKRPELMSLPAGTVFAYCHQEWVFGELEIKGETIADDDGTTRDFWALNLAYPEDIDDLQQLDEMAADSTVSRPYSAEQIYGRHGLYDDDRMYLVYEPADVQNMIRRLTDPADLT